MGHIEKLHFATVGNLDSVSYFHYLIKEGGRLSLITPLQLDGIQYQLVELLTAQFNRYTGGQSSSVTVETGQKIQQSVFYTIGYYFKSFSDAETCLEALSQNTLSVLFEQGETFH